MAEFLRTLLVLTVLGSVLTGLLLAVRPLIKSRTAFYYLWLLVLLRLTAANGHTRCVDLAAALELSPPSVHNMVDTMTALGLVKKGTRGAVSLTEYGSRTAERYQRYYHSAAALLRQGFPELPEPQTMICQLLAQVPEESLAGLCDRQAVEEAAS